MADHDQGLLGAAGEDDRPGAPRRNDDPLAVLFMDSAAFDAVVAADHPTPEAGGPCATCAFRSGTEANRSQHTATLARLCVEGIELFHCHEQPRLCRGWIAAVNLRDAAGDLPTDDDARHRQQAAAWAANMLSDAIEVGRRADVAHDAAES